MSHLVIHKIDIGKVITSKNVMKLLKLLLTGIVKHPVNLWDPSMVALLVGDTLGICVKRGCILAHWSSDGESTYKFISASPPMGPNGDSPCLHTTTASVTTWLVEVRKSGFENIDNWKCAFTCFLSLLLRRFKWKIAFTLCFKIQ